MLPPSQLHKKTELHLRIIDEYVGEYELKRFNDQITIGKQNGNLYIQAPENPKVIIYPETESRFYGTDDALGEIQVIFAMDSKRNVKHFILRVGFLSLQFDKTK